METFGWRNEGRGDNISGGFAVFNFRQGILFLWCFVYFIIVLFLAVIPAE